MKKPIRLFAMSLALGMLVQTGMLYAAQYEVGQKNKEFTIAHMEIKVGDEVSFTNQDPFFHNVFSLSAAKLFDLGSYPQGEGRTVLFDKPGRVDVECSIHPSMHMVIEVKP